MRVRISEIEDQVAATTEEFEPVLKVKFNNDEPAMAHIRTNYIGRPKSLVRQELVLELKVKLMSLFSDNNIIADSLDAEIILNDMETNLIPLINKYIDYILIMEYIGNHKLNIMMNEISNIVFSYIKLEFMRHSLVFKDSFNKNYIDEIFEDIVKKLKGELNEL